MRDDVIAAVDEVALVRMRRCIVKSPIDAVAVSVHAVSLDTTR